MSDERPSEVLGALPRTRPHRRSEKRPARPTPAEGPVSEAKTPTPTPVKPRAVRASKPRAKPAPKRRAAPARKPLRQPAQPAGTPATPRSREPAPSTRGDLLGTAVQAAAELAEIGISAGARALRGAVSRLPRP